nr:YibE/F family protein [Filibacter tadaridae]
MVKKVRKCTTHVVLFYSILTACCITSILFVSYNYSFYDRPIAKVIQTTLEDTTKMADMHNNEDHLFTQRIVAIMQNGPEKGQRIHITNKYSSSGAYDQEYRIGNELFVSINPITTNTTNLTGIIIEVKRDKYVLFIAWTFIFALLIIGRKKGLFSILSFAINVLLLSFALDLYVNHFPSSLLLITSVCILLFTAISLLLVSGFNKKTYAAIVATLIGTFTSLAVAYFVIWVTSGNGLRYEEMQFLTRPYHSVFMAGLFIGSLGAIMDVAITISSSLFALYERNPHISHKALRASGMDIGKDIMGTITSILFFAYISGSIPMLILYLKNASPLGFAFSMNLSLEVARALAGGIGIVLTIPIALHTTLFFIKRKQAGL